MLNSIKRFKKYRDENFDHILLKMKSGEIKCGKYSHLVKIDKSMKFKDGELFKEKGE